MAATRPERVVRLAYRPPYDFDALLAFFARRAIPGVEQIDGESYSRRFALDGEVGSLRVSQIADDAALALAIDSSRAAQIDDIVSRVRRMFDLDADIAVIHARLGRKAPLRALVRKHPGQRLPGGWDGFEIAVRAVLGQQISVAAARTLASRLVQRFGTQVSLPSGEKCHLFPLPRDLVDADFVAIGLTRARAQTLRSMAQALCEGRVDFRPDQGLEEFVEKWVQLPGIGAWTAHYIAMRALSHADAFPAADLVLRKAVSADGAPVPLKHLQAMAEAWRPWRAYAVLHLWRGES
jgi:AraC family transcriptional regulator, regulatory protein of adaptative response / DNA-3-methyladenine glycosylase II